MDAMLRSIHNHEQRLHEKTQSRLSRFATKSKLFVLYLTFALHRGVVLLFAHPSKSFALVHTQDESGVYHASYDEHIRFQHNVRFFSASTLCVLLTSMAIVWSVLNLVFPQGNAPIAYAAVNTFYVNNGNNAGPGSLRQAIIDANGSAPADTNNIQFDVVGQPTISLVSSLPVINRHVEFVNPNAAIALVVDGTALAPGNFCLSFGDGASNSIVLGVAFKACPTAINMNGNLTNMLIGNDADLTAQRVQIWNGNTGIVVFNTVSNSTIKNVVIGQNLAGQLRSLTGTGMNIQGNNNTITKSQVGKANEGIRLQGNNNTVIKSFVGIANIPVADVNIGNTQNGIFIQGNGNTIGSSADADRNVISFNGASGITIQNGGANNNKILKNYIGLNIAGAADSGNGQDGVFITNAGNNFVGDSLLQVGPVISGNTNRGISVANAGAVVSNTIIGLSADQTVAIGNSVGGVNASNAGSPTSLTISQSVVAGNGNTGIFVGPNATGIMTGNFVGINDTQTLTFGNAFGNIVVNGSNTDVGQAGKGNVIVGSTGAGISMNGASGTLNITDNTIKDNTLEGLHVDTLSAGSVLTVTNNTFNSNAGSANTSVATSSNVTFTQNTFIGDNAVVSHGIKFTDVTNGTIDNNDISAQLAMGIFIEGLGSADVHDNEVYLGGNHGIQLDNVHNGTWNVLDNTSHNNTGSGIHVNVADGTAAITIDGNTTNSNGVGILVDNAPGVTVSNNTASQNTGEGIGANTGLNTEITGNTLTNNTGNGIVVSAGSDGSTVMKNTVSGATLLGIFITNSDNVIVGDTSGNENTIVSGSASGVQLDASTNSCQITGNYIGTNSVGDVLTNASSGVLDQGTDNLTNSNTIANNGAAGIDIQGNNGDYLDNIITASGIDGIFVENAASGSVIQRNFIGVTAGLVASPNTSNGIKVSNGATNITIGGVGGANTIADNMVNGVLISGLTTQQILVSRNSIYSNGNLGIDLQSGANNDIQTPAISMATTNAILGTGGYAGGKIELFANGIFVGGDDTIGVDGKWSVLAADYLQPAGDLIGQDITASNIDTLSDTSEFSDAVVFGELSIGITPSVTTTETSATVDVTTDPATTAKIFYGLTSDDLSNQMDDDTLSTLHTFELPSLDPNTTYYYRIDVEAEDLTTASTDVLSFRTGTVITLSTDVTTAEVEATVDVTTDPATTAELSYGTSEGNLSETVSDSTLSTAHIFTLTGLTKATTYYYRVDVVSEDETTSSSGILSFITTGVDFSYATTNTSVADQHVYNASTNLYVAPGGVKLKIFPANSTHDVRLTVRDTDKNVVLQGDWQHVNDQKFVQVLEGLQKNQQYTVQAQAREATSTSTRSEKQKISTFTITRKAPTITSLEGDYTVTTNSQKIEFSGLAGTQPSSQFRFQNAATGEIVYSCGNPCTLPFALSAGVYNVLYESLNQNGVPSAPASHTVVVTHAKITPALNTDPRNSAYIDRIVTSSHVKVVGLGPKDATASVYLNGTKVGEATYISDIGWEYDLNLASQARNKEYLVEVKYTNSKGVQNGVGVYYPFLFIDAVQKPTVSGLAAEYEQKAVFTFTVTATKGNRVNVFRGDTLVHSTENVTGTVEVPVVTDTLGSQTLTIQAEDSYGIKSANATAAYAVVTSITPAPAAPSTDDGETPDNGGTDNGGSDNGSTDNGGTDNGGTDNGGTDNGGTDNGGNTDNGGTVDIGGDVTIPLEYRIPVTAPTEVAALKETLEEQNFNTVTVSAEERIIDTTNGAVLGTKTIAKNALGEQVLRRVTVQGLTADPGILSSLFSFLKEQPSDVLVLSGETEPYAFVTVTIHSDPIVQVTRADSDGKWTMTVPADALPAGEHTAFVQTDSRSVKSDQVEIAKFVVVEEKTISNTTWIFIINLSIAIILLLVAITLQIRGKRKPPVQKSGPSKPAPKKPESTPKKDANDDTPNYHSALGI